MSKSFDSEERLRLAQRFWQIAETNASLAQQVALVLHECAFYESAEFGPADELSDLRQYVEHQCALYLAQMHEEAETRANIADALRKFALALEIASAPQAE